MRCTLVERNLKISDVSEGHDCWRIFGGEPSRSEFILFDDVMLWSKKMSAGYFESVQRRSDHTTGRAYFFFFFF